MRVLAGLLCLVTQAWTVKANVEKTVLLAPRPVALLPNVRPSLDDLRLHVLSPSHALLPTRLPVQFASESLPRGRESWYLLRGLHEGRRYEVRICWPATQPTDFWLDTYPLTQVFDTPGLISSLAQYSELLQDANPQVERYSQEAQQTALQSALFLRVQAAAAFYSTNRTLMENPPPVHVDIILDPFVLNIFPQSLGPFALYVSAVAVGAWFLSGYIYRWLLSVATGTPSKPHTD
ncbi:Nn.00g078460.m01.CDS01 [Neocucurbitaria sp. VM-36]